MNKILNINTIVFITGISLSAVAGFYSIVGLTAIFSGAFWPIIILGTVLEIAKLVSVSWLHYNWKIASRAVRSYLIFAILILMFITSMGIFGFLSKAHIEQQLKIDTGIVTEIPKLDLQIKIKTDQITDLKLQIDQIDKAVAAINDKGKTSRDAQLSLDAAKREKSKRDELTRKIADIQKEVTEIKTQKLSLETEVKKIEVEVGPIKYVAELLFDSNDTKILDKTVRIVIIILISVIDPLAIFLLIAFNLSVIEKSNELSEMEFIDMSQYRLKKKPGRRRKRRHIRRKIVINRIMTTANN
jgi:hypothetical protein